MVKLCPQESLGEKEKEEYYVFLDKPPHWGCYSVMADLVIDKTNSVWS